MNDYILSIIIAAIICAATSTLLPPKTSAGQITKMLSGILLIVTIISPITNLSFRHLKDYIQDLSVYANNFVEEGQSASQEEIDAIIKTECEAYILNKADQMGLQIAVEVVLDENNHSIPSGITVTGTVSPYAKEVLSVYIEDALGIKKEQQKWI